MTRASASVVMRASPEEGVLCMYISHHCGSTKPPSRSFLKRTDNYTFSICYTDSSTR